MIQTTESIPGNLRRHRAPAGLINRIDHILGDLGMFWATLALTGVAVIAALTISTLVNIILTGALPSAAAFEVAGVTTIIVALPIVQHAQHLIRALDRRRHELRGLADDLAAASDAANAANRAKSAFLANMSHELRTPLNAIIGFSEAMKDELFGEVGNPRYRSYAKDIWTSGRTLLAIVDNVLDLARIEAGQREIEFQSVDLAELAQSAVRSFRGGHEIVGKTLEIRDGSPLPVVGNARLCSQILFNVVSNALKFTPAGGRILVSTESAEGFGRVIISDTGIGMDQAQITAALQPFDRADPMVTRPRDMGMGLSLAHALTRHLGGELTISSRPGLGTMVTISLRLPTAEA